MMEASFDKRKNRAYRFARTRCEHVHVDLGAEVRALGNAIVTYSTKVCAHVEDDDASSILEARAALQPIDLHRDANAKKSAATPATPVPEAPIAP